MHFIYSFIEKTKEIYVNTIINSKQNCIYNKNFKLL